MPSHCVEDPDRAALIAALHPEPDRFAQLLSAHGERLDWTRLLHWASTHKVLPLLADRVRDAGAATPIPLDIRERLNAAGRQAVQRNAKALQDLRRLEHVFRDNGIAYIVLKGPVLTDQIYESPSQRHFFDLDLVVREEDVDRAQTTLEGLGYRLWGADRFFGFKPEGIDNLAQATRGMRAAMRRFGHELAFVTDDHSLLPVDLHWRLMPRRRIRGSETDVWESTTTKSLTGLDVRVLGAEATVLHLAMHAWSNRPWNFVLLHLVDVGWALRRLSPDAARLAALADRWGGSGDLARTLYALENALGVEPPPELLVSSGKPGPSSRFREIATSARLLERYAPPAPGRAARLRQEIDWGLAMGTLTSTALLVYGRYTALARYRLGG